MSMMRCFSVAGVLLLLIASCAPNHEPISKKDRQIIAVMVLIGVGVGAGVGAGSVSGSTDAAGAAVGGALAGAMAGYTMGHLVVDHMNAQEKAIRLSEGSKKRDIYVERVRPNVLKLTMERGAEFPLNSSELSPRGRSALDDVANAVKTHGHASIAIVAYANDAPSAKDNRILSEQRARAVADYLTDKGVGSPAIRSEGKGRPIFLPASKTAQKNPWYRRVEIIVKGVET